MATAKRFEVGDTKCLDDGSQDRALLIGCPNRTIISLMFDNKRASHSQVHELDRLLTSMGFKTVEVQTQESPRVIQAVRRRTPIRRSPWN
jgi:hypothetical protein